ncbi:MAG: DNA polymerase III subunit beta [Deltaproteobacteria bacterium]|nr:DNA polymerase III subunit beta [Deltaproteobacteria bacterium]
MQLTMDRETLLRGVGRTLGVVDRRGAMAILSHFLLQAEEGQVTIAATDLEVSFRGSYPAEVAEPGALTLPAHYFHNLVKELPGETLSLAAGEGAKLKLQVGESHYQLIGLPADQFPPIPEVSEETLVTLESRQLKEMIERTIFSVSGDELQYHLSGIFWERLELEGVPFLRLVSTDGHRLTLMERPLPESESFDIGEGILIPRKGVAEISRLLAEEERVALGVTKKSLALRADHKHLFIRLLEKKFPDYKRIVPDSFVYQFVVNRQEFYNTLRRISLLSTERFRGVIMNLSADNLEAHFSNPEVGEGRELITLTLTQGDPAGLPISVGFNARYFLEPLAAMSADEVVLELNDRDRPCRLREREDEHYFAIIMPMSL